MAHSLTSNSFLFITTPHSKPSHKNQKLRVSAQGSRPSPSASFGLGKKQGLENVNGVFQDLGGKISDVKSLIPVSKSSPLGNFRRKDGGTVFVAGATGQAGIRIAQTLLRQGFTVRAGVPDLSAAQELALLASKYKIISPDESKRLFAVESTYEKAEAIAKAISNASKVVVTIGPTENGPSSEVTTADALQVIQASQLAGVGHVAIIYDSKSNSSPSTYSVLGGISSFFSNMFAKSQPLTITEFLEKVVETDLSYTLIKTNLTEDFSPESSYNVVVSAEGTYGVNDFKVSKSQIASLVADVFSNTAVAENKVVKVSTDPAAPSKPVDQLFSIIPEDGRRQAYAEELAKARAEEEAIKASEKAREAAEAAKKLEEEVKKLSEQEAKASSLAEEARKKAEAAGTSVENLFNKAKDMSAGFSWKEFSSQIATAVQTPDEKPKVQIATVRGEAKARTLPAKKAVIKQITPKLRSLTPKKELKSKAAPTEPKKEVKNVFGGLFKQETFYMDDD
ncbi:hypothetical protein IFM89_037519 [Coptis chinensis]|uniref:NAD(P)-binding domain-containing protein n=1 Tax=Coptis chinensis TaxID=261450 RepID=A0A835HXM2_9MAGN|nr:hypothetical protein IFM89_037519 [Coptis chinensis]